MKLLDFPASKQSFNYDCGAAALHAVLLYYGIKAKLAHIRKIAGTVKIYGTPVHGMEKAARHFGLSCSSRKMTVKELKKSIDQGIPVILRLQAWPNRKIRDWRNHWDDGHYAVAIGYDSKRIYFEDPYPGSRAYLAYDELLERWHDCDKRTKKRYRNLGITVKGKSRKIFSSRKIVHMD